MSFLGRNLKNLCVLLYYCFPGLSHVGSCVEMDALSTWNMNDYDEQSLHATLQGID